MILWVDFSVGLGSAVGRAHACALERIHRFVFLSAGTLCPTIRAMVSIRRHAYGRWVRRRRALAARLIFMHNMGYFPDELGVLLRAYRRASVEVALLRNRSLHVTAASFSLNAFCSQESLSLFVFFSITLDRLLCCCRLMYLFPTPAM